MRSRWNLPIYLVYMAISVVVIGYIVSQVGLSFGHRYTVTASFSDAADILVNNEVYVDGARVGHVGAVTVVNGQAQVQLVIEDPRALPLHPDASAEVRKKNLLGETYIDLQQGSAAGQISDGGAIPISRTVPITEIDQVLAIFDPEAVQRLQLLINALGSATNNNGQNMNAEATSSRDFFTALNGPAAELSVRRQQLNDIVLELQRFYAVLANQRTQVRDEFGTWNQVMAQMARQEAAIGGTLQQADALLQNLNALVAGEGGNIRTILDNLPGTLDSATTFLGQANSVTTALAPYRQYINDIFPDLQSSFHDTGPTGQHLLSVDSLNCTVVLCVGHQPASANAGSSSSVWAVYSEGAAK